MCGRYVSASSPQQIVDYFGVESLAEAVSGDAAPTEPNYNVAPSVQVPTVSLHDNKRHLDRFRWGLIPSWAKSKTIGYKMINARSETVKTKNAFRAAAKRRRCIIPADAFYEWTAVEHPTAKKPVKQPWCIQRNDGEPFAFAGLYEFWTDPELDADDPAARVVSCTVLTREANDAMSAIHDRMPVMLAPHRWDMWLDPSAEDIDTLLDNVEVFPSELIEIYPVSRAVNNSRSRGVELLDRVEAVTTEMLAEELAAKAGS